MNKIDLTVPNRQSVKGLVLIFIFSARQAVKMFWPLLLAFVFQNKFIQSKTVLFFFLAAVLILLIVHTILYYLNFFFYVSKGEFILKKGYLRKKILSIPLERIQSINTKQNILQQLLGVVSLEIDTAGSVGKELKIHALEKRFADAFQNEIRVKKSQNKAIESEESADEEKEKEEVVLRLTSVDLLKIGISQNHLRAGLVLIAFGSQIFQQVKDLFKDKANQYSNDFVEYMSHSGWALITFLIILFLIISIVFSLFRTLLKYYDFKLLKKEGNYRIESGLLNKRNVIVPHNKVQELNWETGPLKQLFGIFHLTFKQAVSGHQNRKNQQLVDAPGCLTSHIELLKTDLFGKDELAEVNRIYSNRYYFRRLWIIYGWIPVVLATPFLYSEILFWVGVILWLLGTAGYCHLIVKKRYFRMNEEQIRISKGAVSHQWKQMELFKIQSVKFQQTFFQRRRKLASLHLMNAAGSITIPYIEEKLAMQIYNYLYIILKFRRKSGCN